MKAMIFAAGLGTRLKPLTNNLPKALVEISGKPLLYWILQKMIRSGITEVIINVHHFAAQIEEYLSENHNFGINITISDESDELLDTGGGLRKASWFFDDGKDFLLHNVDVISDIDFREILYHHQKSGNTVTLAVTIRNTLRYFLLGDDMRLVGWENRATGQRIRLYSRNYYAVAFSGIQIINPSFFTLMKRTGKYSLTDEYLRVATDCRIGVFIHDPNYWFDVGTLFGLERAEAFLNDRDTFLSE